MSMIPKSGNRFSEKIMLKRKAVKQSNRIVTYVNGTG
jgi:hypothetical protein